MVLSFRIKSKRNNYYCTCCLYGAGRNDFDAVNINLRGPLEGVGPEIETFLGPEMAKGKASVIWGPKKLRFRFAETNWNSIPLSLRLR
jgi:hypothetical protein